MGDKLGEYISPHGDRDHCHCDGDYGNDYIHAFCGNGSDCACRYDYDNDDAYCVLGLECPLRVTKQEG